MLERRITKERAAIDKYDRHRAFDYLSIFVAVQVIWASILYLIFFVWLR